MEVDQKKWWDSIVKVVPECLASLLLCLALVWDRNRLRRVKDSS